MRRFFMVINEEHIEPVEMHHDNVLLIATHAPTTIYTTDIEDWRDKADHLSTFKVNSHLHLICIDFKKLIQ
jgi:hypothetical protein